MLKHISTPVDGPCKKVQRDSIAAIFQKDLDEAYEQIVYRRKNLFLKKKGSPLSENFHVVYLISNVVPKISAEKIFEAKCNREKN